MSATDQMACVFDLMDSLGFTIEGKSVIDIGCFTGAHAAIYAKAGAGKVLGIDAKEANISKCKTLYDLPNLRFETVDCRDLQISHFEWISAFGIFYHLDNPTELLNIIRELMGEDSYALIDTHVAIDGIQWPAKEAFLENNAVVTKEFGLLSYKGKIYTEFPPETSQENKDRLRRAAYDNATSFWFTIASLEQVFADYGFLAERVFSQAEFPFWRDDWKRDVDGRSVPYSRVAYLLTPTDYP